MFKKSKARGNIRKRSVEDDDSSLTTAPDEEVLVLVPEKKQRGNALSTGTVQREKIALIEQTSYAASGTAVSLIPADMGATATLDVDTELDRDATAIMQRAIKMNQDMDGLADDKLYRGQAGYAQYNKKRDTTAGNAASGKTRIGPVRASANIRVTARFDYQPDVCKDYKETGFCGYGDSCIYLHDRGDYKAGWQIDKEWEAEQRKLREAELAKGDDDQVEPVDENEEDLPFACLICRKEFTNPIVTK
eukprot:Partr_v1_DN27301_c0_g1_i1_m45877 putative Ring finger protein